MFRLFAIKTRTMELISCCNDLYDTVHEYVTAYHSDFPSRVVIAYETDDDDDGPPGSVGERVHRALHAIDKGHFIDNATNCRALLYQFAIHAGIDLSPPKQLNMQLVQDFMLTTDADEIARRAHEATLAVCKGIS